MANAWKELLLAVVIAWVMPWLMVSIAQVMTGEEKAEAPTEPTTVQTEAPRQQTIWVIRKGSREEMALSEYLTGVLLGELPGSFHKEAKKAQAIVARTYTLRTVAAKQTHPGAICTDSTCCQAYTDPQGYLDAGGDPQILRAAREAVEETEGLVLTYQGELIDATYFSSSGGATEDAVAVWGADVPYLQSVESPGEEIASHYTDTVSFTAEEFQAALGVSLKGSPKSWLGSVTYTEGGGVATMVIGGKAYKGTELRSLLGLRSTVFSMGAEGDTIVITTKGHGHRVGMSQYGAQAMALEGHSCQEILAHYYLGTELEKWEEGDIS